MLFIIQTMLVIITIILLIISMKIQIKVQKLEYTSQKIRYKTEISHLKPDYEIVLLLYILNYIPILRIKLTKEKINKINEKTHIKQKIEKQLNEQNLIQLEENDSIIKDIKEILKNIKLNIEELNIKIKIGTEDAVLTSFLIPIISTFIAILVTKKKIKWEKHHFQVIPIYQNKNIMNLEIKGIFEIKVIHIINTICILKKKRRDDKNERTSNRRSYDYSYE